MNQKLILTGVHQTYLSDSIILCFIGVLSNLLYGFITLFFGAGLANLYIAVAALYIFHFSQRFMAEQHYFEVKDQRLFMSRRRESNEHGPIEVEVLGCEPVEQGLKVKYKPAGMSNIKYEVLFSRTLFGDPILTLLDKLITTSDPDFNLAEQAQRVVAEASSRGEGQAGEKSTKILSRRTNSIDIARLTYKPKLLTARALAGLMTSATFLLLLAYLNR